MTIYTGDCIFSAVLQYWGTANTKRGYTHIGDNKQVTIIATREKSDGDTKRPEVLKYVLGVARNADGTPTVKEYEVKDGKEVYRRVRRPTDAELKIFANAFDGAETSRVPPRRESGFSRLALRMSSV